MAEHPEHPQHRNDEQAEQELLARTPAVIAPGHTFDSVTDTISHTVLTQEDADRLVPRLRHRLHAADDPEPDHRQAADDRHRDLGQQHPGRLGVRHHQLRLVDRHRPRRHADLGDSAAVPPAVAHVDQPLRRGDDAVRRRVRGDVPAAAHRPSVAGGLLAVPVSEHDGPVAAVPQPADLGRVRGVDLRHRVGAVLVHRSRARHGDAARSREVAQRRR